MENYDIILEAGQSNCVGYGHGPVTEEYVPDARILYMTGTDELSRTDNVLAGYDPASSFEISLAEERKTEACGENDRLGDLGLTFAKDYVNCGLLQPGRKLLILRTAVGGTGFMFHQWEMGQCLHRRMLDMTDYALHLGGDNRLVAFLWHQGEHEVFEGNRPHRYFQQLNDLLNSVKTRFDCPELPVIMGKFSNEWVVQNQEGCDLFYDVIRRVLELHGGILVETADLLSNHQMNRDGDEIHFCRESLHILGHRYFDAYRKITGGT